MGLIGSTSGPGATVTGKREGKKMKKKNVVICRSVRRKGKRKEGKVREKEENDRAYRNNDPTLQDGTELHGMEPEVSHSVENQHLQEDTIYLEC
jgi:hypothetical protein